MVVSITAPMDLLTDEMGLDTPMSRHPLSLDLSMSGLFNGMSSVGSAAGGSADNGMTGMIGTAGGLQASSNKLLIFLPG